MEPDLIIWWESDADETGPAAYARRLQQRQQAVQRELVTDVVAKEITMSEKKPPSIKKLVAEMLVRYKGGWNFQLSTGKSQSGTAKQMGNPLKIKWRIMRVDDGLVARVTCGNDTKEQVVTNRKDVVALCNSVASEETPQTPPTKLTFFEKKLGGSSLTDHLTITSEHRTVDRLEGVFTDGDIRFDWWVVENHQGLHACNDVHEDSKLIRSIAEFDALLLEAKQRMHEHKAAAASANSVEEAAFMVLIWEENPERLSFYKVPAHKKICATMRAAHGQMINGDDLTDDAPVFAVNEWLQKYGSKYVVNGIVKGHINEIVHCGFIM